MWNAFFNLFRKNLIAVVIVVCCIIYLAYAITPSSYAIGMQMLGQPVKGLMAGTPRAIRSDEWMVFTPYVQLSVNSHFTDHDLISPYHEALRAFYALPVSDWAAVFKPYYAGFIFLPSANAFSFFYLFNSLSFIIGWAWLVRLLLRTNWKIATGFSLILFFSQFVQVWWSSNSGTFALAPWAAIAWITLDRRWLRIALAGYALTVWLLADFYPPFIYSLGLAMFFAVFALRPDLLTISRIVDAILASIIGVGICLAYYGNMIKIMEDTVYPGHRLSSGGGVEPAKLIGHLYPFALTKEYEPLSILTNTNACEVAVVGTMLPLFCLIFLDYNHMSGVLRSHLRSFTVLFMGIIVCAIWIFLPIPASMGKLIGLTLVPGNRLLLALGWLVALMFLTLISICKAKLDKKRLIVGLLVLSTAIYGKHLLVNGTWHLSISYFDYMPLAALTLLIPFVLRTTFTSWVPIVVTALCVNFLTFGMFNPLQSAYPIFSMDKNAIRQHLLLAGAKITNSGDLVIPGNWGALVNGSGIPAYNHVLLYPQLEIFRTYFNDLPVDQFNELFNRYEHVSFKPAGIPRLVQPDLVELPMDRFLDATSHIESNNSLAWARVDSFEWHRRQKAFPGNIKLFGRAVGIISRNNVSSFHGGNDYSLTVTKKSGDYQYFRVIMPSKDSDTTLSGAGLTAIIAPSSSTNISIMSMYAQILKPRAIHDQLARATSAGVIDAIQVSADSKRISLRGWAAANGLASIQFNLASGAQLSAISIKRVYRPDVGRLVNRTFESAGFDIAVDFTEPARGKEICLNVQQGSKQYSNLVFPNRKTGCMTIE